MKWEGGEEEEEEEERTKKYEYKAQGKVEKRCGKYEGIERERERKKKVGGEGNPKKSLRKWAECVR